MPSGEQDCANPRRREKPFGFPRRLRLRRTSDHSRVGKQGKRLAAAHLVMLVLPSELPGPRLGLSVSKKVGNAVVRNRVKRWIREAMRTQQQQLPAYDVVFIARPSAARAGFAALAREIGQGFGRLRRSA